MFRISANELFMLRLSNVAYLLFLVGFSLESIIVMGVEHRSSRQNGRATDSVDAPEYRNLGVAKQPLQKNGGRQAEQIVRNHDKEQTDAETAKSYFFRAMMHKEDGNILLARNAATIACDLALDALGTESGQYAQCLNLLASLDIDRGDFETAELLLAQADEVLCNYKSDASWDAVHLGVLGNLALVKRELKKYAESEALYLEVLNEYGELIDGAVRGILEIAIGNLYLKMENDERARDYFINGIEKIEPLKSKDDTNELCIANIAMHVAQAKLQLLAGENEEAERHYQNALTQRDYIYEKEGLRHAYVMVDLADLYLKLNRTDEAKKWLELAAVIREKHLGANSPLACQTRERVLDLQAK